MKSKLKYSALLVVFMMSHLAFSQKKDENIGTEVVNVVKPYTPTISDAFKVKETPSFEDEEKREYRVQYFLVSSSFNLYASQRKSRWS